MEDVSFRCDYCIHTSYCVRRSGAPKRREELLSAITSAQNNIAKIWRSNIIAEALDNPNDYLFYPEKEVIDGKSKERMGFSRTK